MWMELTRIGRLSGTAKIQWKLYPEQRLNTGFRDEVKAQLAPDELILLLCRSGIRSREVAEVLGGHGFRN